MTSFSFSLPFFPLKTNVEGNTDGKPKKKENEKEISLMRSNKKVVKFVEDLSL
jgi:hypothetical protein